MQKWIILIVIVIIVALSVFVILNVNVETEYTPESEVADEELRKTIITLYFKKKGSEELVQETRLVDSKDLLLDPYEKLVRLLLEGPENESNEKLIPEGVSLLDVKFNNGYVEVNFSHEFSENEYDEKNLTLIFNSIYNTLKELKEVNGIKILVDGVSLATIPESLDIPDNPEI